MNPFPESGQVVAVLGCGRMGSAIAEHLAGAGTRVILYNRTPDRAEALADRLGQPASTAASPGDAAARADVVISMVSDDDAVRELFLAQDGVASAIRPGAVAVNMSTVMPDTIRAVAPPVRARGAGVLDCPVSGSVALASTGKLTLMVGGNAPDLARARPILELIGARIFHIGELGTGAAMKLCVNTVVYGLNGAVAESVVLAERSGIARERAYEVLESSAVGAPFVGYKRPAFVDPANTPVAFAVELAEKDLRLIAALAKTTGTAMPQATVNAAVLRETSADVGPTRDFAEVATHLRNSATSHN